MRTLQQYPLPQTIVPWVLSHLRENRDVAIEFRGPKGFGKSTWMLHLILKLAGPMYPFEKSLCYDHRQFVDVVNRLRGLRKTQDKQGSERTVEFLWADDATRIFNRRAHMTTKNRTILDVSRTMRDAIQAVQLYGTQDNLLERPLIEGGVYLLVLFPKKWEPWVCWPRVDPMMREETEWVPIAPWRLGFDPSEAYRDELARYIPERRRLTDSLLDESLRRLRSDPAKLGAPRTFDDGIRREVRTLRNKGWTQRRIATKTGMSQPRVSQLLRGTN